MALNIEQKKAVVAEVADAANKALAAVAAEYRGLTVEEMTELRAKARRKKKDEDLKFIAIDYLQLMKSRTKQAENSREREIAEISAGIKGLAKELGIPILILAQLNRGNVANNRAGAANRALRTLRSGGASGTLRSWGSRRSGRAGFFSGCRSNTFIASLRMVGCSPLSFTSPRT